MGIVKGFTQQVELPDGHRATIRMLSYLELQDARDQRIAKLAERARAIKDLLPERSADAARRGEEELRRDPLAGYDVATLLGHGLVSWDYEIELDASLLDERTAFRIARAIVAASNPDEEALGKE